MIVCDDPDGEPVIGDIIFLAKGDPPSRPSRKFVGTVEEVRERAERRRIEEQLRLQELTAEMARSWRTDAAPGYNRLRSRP